MNSEKRLSDSYVNKAYSTVLGGLMAISIVAVGNQVVSIDRSYDCSGQIVSSDYEKTNVYTSFSSAKSIFFNVPGYSNYDDVNSGIENMTIGPDKLDNIKKLETISNLQDNWNDNGAKAFSVELLDKVRNLIVLLDVQPEIFPTACESLQLEYDKDDGSHIEIEVNESDEAEIFVVDNLGNESISRIKTNADTINKAVKEFYG